MNRVAREKEIYNSGTVNRSSYERIFSRSSYAREQLERLMNIYFKDAENSNVLEIGSNAWIGYFNSRNIKPKKLTCINISEKELELGIKYKKINNIDMNIDFKIMDANNLQFKNNEFDFIYGGAIIHHLNVSASLFHINRCLKPSGTIFFHEPLRGNPISLIVRMLTPKARTKDEMPLGKKDLNEFKKYFKVQFHFNEFLSVPAIVFSRLANLHERNIILKSSNIIDHAILNKVPFIKRMFREVLIYGKKIE
jgi:SAM-dependent methyltransferase